MRRLPVLALAVVLAGCGSGSAPRRAAITVPGYGEHPATTEAVVAGSPSVCRAGARIVARDAARMMARYSGAAYPADLYYVILRQDFVDYQAHGCGPGLLGRALAARLSAKQRTDLVSALPRSMAAAVRAALRNS